jgi:dUTP pyrophosphatase
MKFVKVREVKSPNRGTSESAGIDLFIPNDFPETNISPGDSVCIPAGLKVKIPTGHALIAMNKSGIAMKRNLLVGACVIDEDYQGEIHIDLKNVGSEPQILSPGDKITQVLCLPVNYTKVEEVESEHDLYKGIETERGVGGFGSTGTR